MLPTSSIAMATYNGEKYLQRQLDSFVEQTVLPNELVVCDDGSTDKTVEILHHFAKTAPFPVRIFQNDRNLGICANFCKAFSLCEKDVTFFSDQDDYWFPQKLEKVLKVMETEPEVGLVLTYDQRVDANEKPVWMPSLAALTSDLKKENSIRTLFRHNRYVWATHNMACRTSWRERIMREKQLPVCIDTWLFRVMGIASHVRVIPEPCCAFRRHGENATSHSRGEKNLLILLYRSVKRHCDIYRMYGRYLSWQEVVSFFQDKSPLDEEILAEYQQITAHLRARIEILTHFWRRPWFWGRELFTGRYFRYSTKCVCDIFSDLFAWPQKLPQELERKE
ncbi:MAG: glycosyltransferase [Planctomycetia bacterium]|nr:glycosyltransferase [Planctomycetia bacterium]